MAHTTQGRCPLPLDQLIEQLWQPHVDSGDVRVVVNPAPDDEWVDTERYWLVPDVQHTRLLLPRGPSRVAAAAASQYAGLRPLAAGAVRVTAGAIARTGLPLSRHTAAVQVRRDRVEAQMDLPLRQLAEALGEQHLWASMGVRTGANRKPTLSLVDATGRTRGYAKIAWNAVSEDMVRTETAQLLEVDGGEGPVRVPRVLAELKHAGFRVLVTEPLPSDVRGGSRRGFRPPTPEEVLALVDLERFAPVHESEHARDLERRLQRVPTVPRGETVSRRAVELLRVLLDSREQVPIGRRWHGDFTPWNVARDGEGRLWVWDWETAEHDAAVGLDALHWAFSRRRLRARRIGDISVAACRADAEHHLVAAGLSPAGRSLVTLCYVLTVVERALTLAESSAGWDRVWVGVDDLLRLLDQAAAMLEA